MKALPGKSGRHHRLMWLALGLSLMKYSFSPVAGVFLLCRQRYLVLLIAVAVCCAGLAGCFVLLPTPLLQLAREPFLVSRVAVNPGVADLMTLSEFGLRSSMGSGRASALSYGIALVGGAACGLWISRLRVSKGAELCLLSLASLLCFKHLIYDYVFLLIPLCYAASLKTSRRVKAPLYGGVALFWFLAGLINHATTGMNVQLGAQALNCLLLTMLFVYAAWVVASGGQDRGSSNMQHGIDP